MKIPFSAKHLVESKPTEKKLDEMIFWQVEVAKYKSKTVHVCANYKFISRLVNKKTNGF